MVYLLPLYHPLRLIDEVCMLDQMSEGRFLYGVGRGISPVEVGFYGVDFATGAERFREAFEVTRIGLTENELTFHGKYYDFDHVPIVMKPVQKPYPELWYGTSRPDSIPWAAERGAHIVTLRDNTAARAIIDLYKEEWRKHGRAEADLPKMGINRHLVVAETEAAAREVARRGYRPWRQNIERLWAAYGVPFPLKASLPEEWDELQAHGHAIAGTPAQVRDYHRRTDRGIRRDLFRLRFRVRHDHPRRGDALGRTVRRRGDAGNLRERLTRRRASPAKAGEARHEVPGPRWRFSREQASPETAVTQ